MYLSQWERMRLKFTWFFEDRLFTELVLMKNQYREIKANMENYKKEIKFIQEILEKDVETFSCWSERNVYYHICNKMKQEFKINSIKINLLILLVFDDVI